MTCIRIATVDAGGATNLTVKAASTAGDDNVSAVVEADADAGTRCSGEVQESRFSRRLPGETVTGSGAVYWQWRINGRVPAGSWTVVVACHGAGWRAKRTTHFRAVSGIGPGRLNELFVPDSLKQGASQGDGTKHGSGGGGRSLYPQGQCTWWVALLRPDLPWFPGEEGNALNWAAAARKRHLATGTRPAVHAVAVFAPGQDGAGRYGHVAYVVAVEESTNTITVSEYNFEKTTGPDTRSVSALGLTFIYEGSNQGEGGGTPGEGGSKTTTTTPPPPPPPVKGETYSETPGSEVHTWTEYSDGGGTEGAPIPAGQAVQVSCKVEGLKVQDGDVWWYRLASSPWDGVYYASADPFYNDGATSGSLIGTPAVDPRVPNC
ncbi:MAG: CHAP domain-containing protein [Solirubrobacteraceae bacterium]